MVIESTRKGNSIFDEMKSRVFSLYMMKRQSAYETYTADDELKDALAISEDEYSLNLYKLDELVELSKMSQFLSKQFITQKMYIEQMDIPEKDKIESILTSACIFKNFGVGLINRNTTEEEFYLIARAMVNVEPISYSYYEHLILGYFDILVKMLKNIEGLKVNHVKQDKQYVKTENN